jgi:hypothetical protein
VDAESGEGLDQLLGGEAVARYQTRFRAHQAQIEFEARRVRARWATVDGAVPLEGALQPFVAAKILEPRGQRS